jgi:hypothetical protein
MGIRPPSFEVCLLPDQGIAANAAVPFCFHGPWQPSVFFGGQELAVTVTDHGAPTRAAQGNLYGSLRPVSGDWPVGALEIHARQTGGERELQSTVLIEPARNEAPQCESFGVLELRKSLAQPTMPSYEYVGLAHGPIVSTQGPFVICTVEHESGRWLTKKRGSSRTIVLVGQAGVMQLPLPLPRQLLRVQLTDLAGGTLEVLPPFPKGQQRTQPAVG